MTLAQVLPTVRQLSSQEKLKLIQILAEEERHRLQEKGVSLEPTSAT